MKWKNEEVRKGSACLPAAEVASYGLRVDM